MALVDQPCADCVASELGTPDCDVGPRGLLEPLDGVSIELALDPGPRAGYLLKRPGVHDLVGCPPDAGIVAEHRRLMASVITVSQKTIVSYIRRP